MGNVNMSAAGLPPGASYVFNPNPATVPGTTDIAVTVAGGTAGTYPVTVSATDGVHTHTADLTLAVADAAPGEPVPITPPNGAFNQPPQPLITSTAPAQAATSEIQIAL